MLNFTPPAEIQLRDYQADAIEGLRDAIRAGQRRVILCAGTGAGKTVCAAHLLREADRKGSYALFLVDRVALVDQTSATLDSYGIRHGVIQGRHERWAPRENVQVASVQTLARRTLPRQPDLIVWDECHSLYSAMLDYIGQHPQAVVVGLTATPFTKGLGKHWHGVVNVIPTRRLLDSGYLVEPTIYVARSPDDADFGLNKYGEFSESSASAAGIQIIGDVVSEWERKTTEHFGGPAKTIVFSPTVEHGRELCAAFSAAGYNFQQVSYLDRNDADRAEKISEFRRPDSIIHGLVSCGVLTKGFDVPDVACIASGQRVLTDKGLVPIEKVTLDHKLWDGIEWVTHHGVVFKGYQHVIEYAGLVATEGHEVQTSQGWRAFGDCAAKQIGIAQTGLGERPLRQDEGRFTGDCMAQARALGSRPRSMRMHQLRQGFRSGTWAAALQPAEAWLSGLLFGSSQGAGRECPTGLAHTSRQKHEVSLPEAVARCVAGLRGARYRVPVPISAILRGMGCAEPWPAEAGPERAVGSRGQRWPLRARESSLGLKGAQLQQHAPRRMGRHDAPLPHGAPRDQVCGQDLAQPFRDGAYIRAGSGAVLSPIRQAKRPVWDILQAGPRNRFTCEGLLVHNCGISCKPYRKSLSSHMQEIGRVMRSAPGKDSALWLCHSGNVERFALDTFDVWEHGAGPLDDAEKRDAKPRERNRQEREKVVCPECSGALRGNICMACGWERPARSGVVTLEGELQAFDMSAPAIEARDGLRAECLADPRKVWDAALAHTLPRARRGEEAARKWAYGIWRGVYPSAKLPRGWFGAPLPALVDPGAAALVEREVKRFRKRRRAA